MTIYTLDILLFLFGIVCCSMSSSNCCFLTCMHHIQGNIIFLLCLTSFSMIISRSIHAAANAIISFFLIKYSIVYMYYINTEWEGFKCKTKARSPFFSLKTLRNSFQCPFLGSSSDSTSSPTSFSFPCYFSPINHLLFPWWDRAQSIMFLSTCLTLWLHLVIHSHGE